jgi:hypothetical protein
MTILALFAAPALAFDDVAFCSRLNEYAEKINAKSSSEGMTVSCGNRTVDFRKSLALNSSRLDAKWHALQQREWNAIYCRNVAWVPVLANGWKVSTTLTTLDGKSVKIDAVCK